MRSAIAVSPDLGRATRGAASIPQDRLHLKVCAGRAYSGTELPHAQHISFLCASLRDDSITLWTCQKTSHDSNAVTNDATNPGYPGGTRR
eukprot:7951028-Pyramimonas_sp.AAC.1